MRWRDGIALEGWSLQKSGTWWIQGWTVRGQWPWLGEGVKEHSSRCSDSRRVQPSRQAFPRNAERWQGHSALGAGILSEYLLLYPLQEIPLRSNVYEVYATDKDEGLHGAVRYSFLKTAGNRDWEYFTIDPVSGLIQTAQRLDREKQAVYSVRGRGLARGAGPSAGGGAGRERDFLLAGPLRPHLGCLRGK